jgi:exonuclease SbcC
MIPIKLEIQNFLPYINPDPLDFTGLHVACLTGENGAGKSSLLDAMTWALWGRARAKTDEELIHQGANEMRVAFTFELNQQTYQVIRQKKGGKRGGSSLEIQVRENGKWKSQSEATINATQKKIIALLKLDYDTFTNSAYLQQGRADEFTNRTAAQRKQVLSDILGLEQWEVYEDRAKRKINSIREEIITIDGEIGGYDRELNRKTEYEESLAQAQRKLDEAQEKTKAAEAKWNEVEKARSSLESLRKQIADLDKRIAQNEKELSEIDVELRAAQAKGDPASLAQQLDSLQQSLAKLDEADAEKNSVTANRQAAAEESARRKGENDTLAPQTEPIKRRIETLESATEPICPTCGQPLTEDHRHTIIKELTQEVEARRGKYRENTAKLKSLSDDLTRFDGRLNQLNAELRERPNLQKRLADLQTKVAAATEAQTQIEKLNERRARWLTGLDEDRSKRKSLEDESQKFAALAVDADDMRSALDKLRLEARVATEELGAARQRLSALETLSKRRAEKTATRDKLAKEQGMFEELREAFGKRGVPAMIIEAAVPEIENKANELLQRMTAGRMNVRFETQRETQAGDVRETLDIKISDELGTRPYENYSGGEQFRVNFAIRIALSQLLARRAGAQLQTLIVDEGFGSQDAQGREKLVSAINSIADDFRLILVITHIDELKDAFPAQITVTKTGEGSVVEVG